MNIIFTGDVCFMEQHEMDETLAKKVLSGLQPTLDSADYLVMNLETPLAKEGVGAPITKSGPNIIGRPENVGFLTEAGCSLAVLANNHTGDYGGDALRETIELLDEKRIAHIGAGENIAEAYRAVRTEIGGKKFSFVGINENEFGIDLRDFNLIRSKMPKRLLPTDFCLLLTADKLIFCVWQQLIKLGKYGIISDR